MKQEPTDFLAFRSAEFTPIVNFDAQFRSSRFRNVLGVNRCALSLGVDDISRPLRRANKYMIYAVEKRERHGNR
jgi:hypothetical protein